MGLFSRDTTGKKDKHALCQSYAWMVPSQGLSWKRFGLVSGSDEQHDCRLHTALRQTATLQVHLPMPRRCQVGCVGGTWVSPCAAVLRCNRFRLPEFGQRWTELMPI